DKTGATVMGEFGDRLARQFGGAAVEGEGLIADSELAQGDRRAAKAVRRGDRVAAGREIAAVDLQDEIGPALAQDLGAVLVPPKIALDIKLARLHLRADRPVAEQHTVGEIIEQMRHRGITRSRRRHEGRARPGDDRSRRSDRRGSVYKSEIRGRHWRAAAGIARRRATRRRGGAYRDHRRARRNALPSSPGSRRRSPPPCASAARNW